MSEWQEVAIGEVCDLVTGGTPDTKKREYFDGGQIPWLVSGDIHHQVIGDCEGRITEAGLANSNARWLPTNSVMIALAGQGRTRGTVALLRMRATCNQSLVAISPKTGSGLVPEFLFWNLRSRYAEIRRLSGDDGNERRGLNMSMIRSLAVPLPSLEEQKRIVAKLDAAWLNQQDLFGSIDRQSRSLSLIMPSLIEKLMASPSRSSQPVKIGDLLTVEHGFAFKSEFFSEVGDAEILTPGHFHESGGFRPRPGKEKYYTGEYPERFELSPGTLLVAMTEQAPGLLGSPLLVPNDGRYLHNQRLGRVIPRHGIDPRFLYWIFNLPTVRRQLSDSCSGATVRHTSPGRIESVQVSVPLDSGDQVAVTKKLDEVKRLVDTALALQTRRRVAVVDFERAFLAEALRVQS